MTPDRLRAYVLILVRDVLPPLVGAFLSIYLPLSHQFAYWQLPLLAGLFGVPLVSRDSAPLPDPRENGAPLRPPE